MKHSQGAFKSARNAYIYYQAWLPEAEVKAIVLIVHGLGEHSGRYTNFVNHFTPLGYAIYGFDLPGHGRSEGEREFIQSFDDYTDTLSAYYKIVIGWQPGKPIFLLGHSLGGLIACYYLLDYSDDFKGAIISAPGIKLGEGITPIMVNLSKMLSTIAPKVGVATLDASLVSRDPEVVQAYRDDPLVFHAKTPARTAGESLKAIARLSAEIEKITLPFIVVQGELDKLVNPAGAQMLYDRASSADKTINIYEGLHHEVFNEPEHAKVLKDVEAWLQAHV
jgi:alpha-beta hydrolase superfamily lysophospholipase